MQFSLAVLSAIALAQAAYVPSEPWTTLTPAGTYSAAVTDHAHPFGIQIQTIPASSSSSTDAKTKRDVVNQIGDGQIQKQTSQTLSTPTPKTTASVINQIGDGQIQHQTTTTAAKTTASVVNQIGDGQIQHQTTTTATTARTTASVVNQIGDGQIQHQTTTTASVVNQIGDGQIQHQTTTTASVVNQITDGQIQHQTTTTGTASVVNQITDGQIQHQTTSTTTGSVVNQITDGQIQHQTSSTIATATGANQISDGQVQATGTASEGTPGFPIACGTTNSLSMTLKGSELKDSLGRIGAIVANRQFQFDGPPPQAGSIYAAGWSITSDGYLAIGSSKVFYQCKSGDFYNLYDQSIGGQCEPVHLSVIDLVTC